MEMKIDYWESSGRMPVADFVADQPVKAQDKILWEIRLLRELGLTHMMKDRDSAKKIGSFKYPLYELRVKVNRVLYRIMFAIKDSVIWLLTAFKKQGNKTPKSEINKAMAIINVL